jgi:hypothetical protein
VSHSENPALVAARRAAKADKGPPPADYRPPVQVSPGKRIKVLPGQLDLDRREHGHREEDDQDAPAAA